MSNRQPTSWLPVQLIISSWLMLSQTAFAAPNTKELLAGYESSLALWQRVHFKLNNQINFEGDWTPGVVPPLRVVAGDMFRDGDRSSTSLTARDFKDIAASIPFQPVRFRRTLFHTRAFRVNSWGGANPDEVLVSDQDWRGTVMYYGEMNSGVALDSVFRGNNGKTFAEVLRDDTDAKCRVRDKQENVEGHPTWVLEADTNRGHYTFWLDVKIGFHPGRIVVKKEEGDMHGRAILPIQPPPVPRNGRLAIPNSPMVALDMVVDQVKLEKFKGKQLPVQARIVWSEHFQNGMKTRLRTLHQRNQVDLRPDFDALGAFRLDVPDGTPVIDLGDWRVKRVWRDGKIHRVDEQR